LNHYLARHRDIKSFEEGENMEEFKKAIVMFLDYNGYAGTSYV